MKNYLLFDEENEVVTLKKGDVIYCECKQNGVSGVAKVGGVNYQNGTIELEEGINNTGRCYRNAVIYFSNYVRNATDPEVFRLVNAVDAMDEEREELKKEVEGIVNEYACLRDRINKHLTKLNDGTTFPVMVLLN